MIDSVSRRHAMLWQEDGDRLWMYALGSANGTFVEGIPASEPVPIETGQRVAFGTTPYVLQIV